MIRITKIEQQLLDAAGVLQYKRKLKGGGITESNFTVVNRCARGRNKHAYIMETPDILCFLGRFDSVNLQKITPEQLKVLVDAKLVTEKQIQHDGEYKPEATVYVAKDGQIYCKKITDYMLAMGIWKK